MAYALQRIRDYNYEETTEFLEAYNKLKININDPKEIRAFMSLQTTKFFIDTYHVNSYVQEDLVKIYDTLDDMYRLLSQDVNRSKKDQEMRWICLTA